MSFGKKALDLDAAAETERIVAGIEGAVRRCRRHGAVVGVSGGIDSSVVLALCVRALGPEKVSAVMLPERDSDPESRHLAEGLAAQLGVVPVLEEITAALEGYGCYARRDDAIRRVFPEYDSAAGYTSRITLPGGVLENQTLNIYLLTIVAPDGHEYTQPLPPAEFLQVVAASNLKQRTRMSLLYYHAELRQYAVVGTANKNEHDQGFFVKYGDGGVDIQPIVHLYKTQVYQLAAHLNLPAAIRQRTPTTDTYSARTSQEDFFFRMPFETMDLLWYAQEHGIPLPEVAQASGLSVSQIERAYSDFARKNRTTAYLRAAPITFGSGAVGRAAAAD